MKRPWHGAGHSDGWRGAACHPICSSTQGGGTGPWLLAGPKAQPPPGPELPWAQGGPQDVPYVPGVSAVGSRAVLWGLHTDGTAGLLAARGSSRTSMTPNAGKQRDTECEHVCSCAERPKQLKPVAVGGIHGKSQSRGPRSTALLSPALYAHS